MVHDTFRRGPPPSPPTDPPEPPAEPPTPTAPVPLVEAAVGPLGSSSPQPPDVASNAQATAKSPQPDPLLGAILMVDVLSRLGVDDAQRRWIGAQQVDPARGGV